MIKKSQSLAAWFSLLCVPLFACTSAHPGEKAKDIPMVSEPSVAIFKLTGAELQFHMPRALSGNRTSAYCLAMHFSFVDFQNPDTEYWMTIAAENGDSASMQMLSIRLAAQASPRAKSRAIYWKDRAAASPTQTATQAQCHTTSD